MLFGKRKQPELVFDPEREYPVFLSSICTGEKAAGFRNKTDHRFREVMLIRSNQDLAAFMKRYGITETPEKIY